MKTLVVYYSRDGTTRKVGEEIAKTIGGDVEEIFDTVNRQGALGYMLAGRDAMRKKLTTIKETKKDPNAYDLVVVGTPIWGGNMTPPIRTFLTQNNDRIRNVAFYCTEGGSGGPNAFKDMEEACGKKPKAMLEVTEKNVATGQYMQKVKKFAEDLGQIFVVCRGSAAACEP